MLPRTVFVTVTFSCLSVLDATDTARENLVRDAAENVIKIEGKPGVGLYWEAGSTLTVFLIYKKN